MTNKDIALALLLWRNMHLERYCPTSNSASRGCPTEAGLEKNDAALDAAGRLGVKAEYLDLLFLLPVMSITVAELEVWPEKKTKERKSRKAWAEWKRPGAGGKDRG